MKLKKKIESKWCSLLSAQLTYLIDWLQVHCSVAKQVSVVETVAVVVVVVVGKKQCCWIVSNSMCL